VRENPWEFWFGGTGEIQALLQLYISTKERQYADKFKKLLWPALEKMMDKNMQYAARAVPFLDKDYKKKLIPFVKKYKAANEAMLEQNPFGVPITTRGWAGNETIIDWAVTNYLLHKSYPEIIGPEYTYRGLNYIYGCHPYSNISFVSGIGVHSKKTAYGNNRADFTFIAGGVVPGILLIKPDFPENKSDWPFLWRKNEYIIDICSEYILLVTAVLDLGNEKNDF
jgi:endoglucanase